MSAEGKKYSLRISPLEIIMYNSSFMISFDIEMLLYVFKLTDSFMI